jgi:hypothetical protein
MIVMTHMFAVDMAHGGMGASGMGTSGAKRDSHVQSCVDDLSTDRGEEGDGASPSAFCDRFRKFLSSAMAG